MNLKKKNFVKECSDRSGGVVNVLNCSGQLIKYQRNPLLLNEENRIRSCRGKHVEIDNPYKITVISSNLSCIIGENVVGLFHIYALSFVSARGRWSATRFHGV